MIIPVRCMSCNKVIVDLWEYFKVEREKINKKSDAKYFDDNSSKELLDKLGLDRYCCRRMMLGHVDIIDDL